MTNDKFVNCLMVIGICLVIGIWSLVIPQQAAAVTVTVQMDGAGQVLKDHDHNALATGDAIQIISTSGGTINLPDITGEATGGDSIIWTGAVGEGGLGSGAFIKAFAGGQSLTDGGRIYVRGWSSPTIESSNYYGDSELSGTLDAGEPPMPKEWSVPSFETSTVALAVNTFSGSDVQVNLCGASVIFSQITLLGITKIVSSDAGPALPGSFGLLGKYYKVETTATYSGTIEVSFPYDDTGLSTAEEQQLKLEQYDATTDSWADITTTVETTNNIISGETTHLSYFAILGGNTSVPTLEWVEINGVPFHNLDVISGHCDVAVRLSDEQGVATIELTVADPDYPPSETYAFTPDLGTTFEGTWMSSFMVHRGRSRSIQLYFHTSDSKTNSGTYTFNGRIVGGVVSVVGRAYNYPNPFKPMSGGTTNIQYVLSQDATITLIIYDITGHEVKRMKCSSGTAGGRGGTNQVSWNGRSLGGEVAGNGMYFYKIISGDEVIGSGKLVIFE